MFGRKLCSRTAEEYSCILFDARISLICEISVISTPDTLLSTIRELAGECVAVLRDTSSSDAPELLDSTALSTPVAGGGR